MEVRKGVPDRNGVKTGYKRTEVGVIPEDWEAKKLGTLGSFKKGRGIRKDEVITDGFPCIRYGELYTTHHEYIKQFKSFISKKTAKESQIINNGDLLFAGSGETREEIGKCAAFITGEEAYAGGDVIIFSPADIDSLYLGFLLNQNVVVKQKSQKAQGDAVVHIYPNNLSEIFIPLPPTKAEQTAIATALSDADALIQSLEKLIAKKRLIKQGTMQELLKPKEGWVVKKLGEICFPSKKRINPVASPDNYKCVELEHLSQETGRLLGYVDSKGQLSQKSYFGKGDVLFGKLRPYLKKFFYANFDGVCSTEIWVLKAESGIVSKWLYYLIQTNNILEAANQSTGTKMPRAEWSTVENVDVFIPTTVEEQTRIATILSDMDADIAALETKLAKYKQVKQGMMQNLLTGKIRLV